MKKTSAAAIFLVLCGSTLSASAQNLRGSDTLEPLTTALLCTGTCGNTTTLKYLGGGSGTGETAMVNGAQQIAPMSRALNNNATVCGPGASTGEAMVVALDGILAVVNSGQSAACGGNGHAARNGTTPPVPPYANMGTSWAATLKLLYSGDGTGSAAACNSTARNTLANSWKSLFDASCTAGTCTGVTHAFRRGDLSGTTDLFKTIVGITTFCNGTELDDKDPIRRACSDSEQVCSSDGKLGLVLPVLVPEEPNTCSGAGGDPTKWYNQAKCSDGKFKYQAGPFDDSTCCFRAVDGTCRLRTVLAKCLEPVTTANQPCLNGFTSDDFDHNVPLTAGAIDSRFYNLHVRDASGNLRTFANGNEILNAYYRIHGNTAGLHNAATASPATLCQQLDSTEAIGCLVSKASPCSIGFAGGDSKEKQLAEPLALNAIDPTLATIQNLQTATAPVYPLARKLFLATLKGFENVTGEELNLAKCFADGTKVGPIATSLGFFPLPPATTGAGDDPVCEDACGATPVANACAGNPAPFN